ncbi:MULTISPECIES: flagellar protein FlaG [Pseudomonas]|uniref:Flagellar protein FlaG n=1 Tax=Pseudomonas shahriarae TaxID=2745512 RepID=A0ABT5NK30_9PSED|nr:MULTISPECIES: flagellar protein FlaG [Pseudomonas]MDD0988894.1 flagellar protein FlaG [Pseudomonas shahriarae]MDD1036479.1 flagellar protein FlaG [Pseudomonas shahriarae]NMY84750.1 flagellar protein FlaG [Pseudomonas sp. WS 5411]OAE14373.1 flagellar biosynthesis protein FlaG [Pseudomonas brenneri]
MDMSVKLNLSYTTAAAAQVVKTPEIVNQPKVEVTAQAAREPRRDDLEKAVTDIREFVQAARRELDFSIDDSTGKVVVKVIATDSGEVIRQIPSETALKLAQSLTDASSLLFDMKA